MATSVKQKEITQLDKRGIDFLVNEEGVILHPYQDSIGIWTIGIGSTYWENGEKVKKTDPPITKARAVSLFLFVLKNYEKAVWSVTRDDISQNQFNALTSIAYNIGVVGFKGSTLLKRVNLNPLDPKIADAFKMWQNAGKKRGILLDRRIRESRLYFS